MWGRLAARGGFAIRLFVPKTTGSRESRGRQAGGSMLKTGYGFPNNPKSIESPMARYPAAFGCK